MQHKKVVVSLILNSLIIVLEAVGFSFLFSGQGGNLGGSAPWCCFFTNLSNLFLLVASCLVAAADIIYLLTKHPLVQWVTNVKFAATISVVLTFLTVYCFLFPTSFLHGGNFDFIADPETFLWFHTVCPILAFVSFAFFEPFPRIKLSRAFYGVIPMLVYAIVIIPLVATNVIEAPYSFLRVNENAWYITLLWCVVMVGGTYLISFLVLWLREGLAKHANRH